MRWLEAPDIYDDPDSDITEWLNHSRVAHHYGKAPWEMLDVPLIWFDLAEVEMDVKEKLAKMAQVKAERRAQ